MSIIWSVTDHRGDGKLYRTAIKLAKRLRLHIFWRGDHDRALHDHPNDFWTFPLRTYWEEYFDEAKGYSTLKQVKAFRWHFRRAEYRHRVLGTNPGGDPKKSKVFITIVKEAEARRQWGFWVWNVENNAWRWVYWGNYLTAYKRIG